MSAPTEALRRIAGFTLSQFMGPHDMALECVNVARAALAAAEAQPTDIIKAARAVVAYRRSMSYNDSYFGEPAGLFKTLVADLDRALPPVEVRAAAQSVQPPADACDSPALCKANGACAGQYGTQRQCSQPVAEPQDGYVIAPHFRGYAHLGTGNYRIDHSAPGQPAELVVSIATEADKAGGRQVGEDRDNEPGALIYPEAIAVRLRFENVAGLDALEKQLRYLREVHFPESVFAPVAAAPALEFDVTLDQAASKLLHAMTGPALDDEHSEVRLQLGHGHSGRGLYVSDAEYPEEGVELLASVPAAPALQPLTDEQVRELWSWSMTAEAERTATTQQHAFARAVERAHGIGGKA